MQSSELELNFYTKLGIQESYLYNFLGWMNIIVLLAIYFLEIQKPFPFIDVFILIRYISAVM